MDGGERDKKIPPVEPEQEKPDSESAVNAASETSEPETPETAEAEGGQEEPSEVETAQEPSDVDITEEPAAKAAAAKKPAKAPVTKKKPRPVKKKGPAYEDLEDDPLAEALREHFGDSLAQAQSFLDQKIYTVSSDQLFDIMLFLRDRPEWAYDYLIDVTVLDYLGDEKRFCLIYHLYSYPNSDLIRVKSRLGHDEVAPSMTSIWKTADWLEREAYDMFGVEFSGHPDLRRILLPEDWHGFPLRKDYDIKLQDQAWIKEHLRIRKVPS